MSGLSGVYHLDVCDLSDCRVAFISRGQPQEVASVASDASAVQWWHIVGADNQQALDVANRGTGALDFDWPAFFRLDLKGSGDKVACGSKNKNSAYLK